MHTKLMQYLLIISFSVLLSGCATMQKPVPITPPARIGLQLAPATFGQSITLQQHLTVTRAGHTNELDTVLQIDSQQLNLVGLAFGQRIMTLHYDGKTLQTWRHPRLPAQVSGENVLEDIELTLWPLNAIRKALPAGWSIEQTGKRRIVLLNNTPIVIIAYSSRRRWDGKVVLTNLRYHYQLTIQSATV